MDLGDILFTLAVMFLIGAWLSNRLGFGATQLRSLVSGWTGGPGGAVKKFLLNFIGMSLGNAVLMWAIYLSGFLPGMFKNLGAILGTFAFYEVIVLALAYKQAFLTGTAAKVTKNLAFAAAIVVGLGETWLFTFGCDDACQLHKQQAAEAAVVQQAIHEDPYCNRRKVDYQFGTTEPAVPFNPAGQCAPELWHDGHCLWIRQAGNSTPIKHCGGAMPPDVESAWSADTAFEGAYKLLPPRYTTLARFKH